MLYASTRRKPFHIAVAAPERRTQFYLYFTEGPHNSFLNAFMSGGWLAGFGYFSLSLVTTATSTRFLFTRTPWQPIYHALYAAYLGTVAESVIMAASMPYRLPVRTARVLAAAAA
jgi:hypothetical protein